MSIELVNVSKAFGETQVLRGLSERFAQGEAVCVEGRSGLGKTTLARIVMGLEKPDAGRGARCKGKTLCSRLSGGQAGGAPFRAGEPAVCLRCGAG